MYLIDVYAVDREHGTRDRLAYIGLSILAS